MIRQTKTSKSVLNFGRKYYANDPIKFKIADKINIIDFNIITELPTTTQEFVARWIGHEIFDFELWKIKWPQNSTIIPIDFNN